MFANLVCMKGMWFTKRKSACRSMNSSCSKMSSGTGTKTVGFVRHFALKSWQCWTVDMLGSVNIIDGDWRVLIAFEATRCLKSFILGKARMDCNALAASAPLI